MTGPDPEMRHDVRLMPLRSVADLVDALAAAFRVARESHVPGAVGIDEPVREAREIVAALYDAPRFWPIANGAAPLDDATIVRAESALRMRLIGAPLAYAVGRSAFRNLTLEVDERVLIPRPETERLVDLVLGHPAAAGGGTAIDVGTGSGAIALALATEGRFDRVIATDISRDALTVAEGNAERLHAQLKAPVSFAHGSLLAPLPGVRARVIVSNPPYIAAGEALALPASVRDWEPAVALYSGPDGLAATARLVRDAADGLDAGGLLAMEVDARRASLAAELAATDARYEDVRVELDLTGRERFVLATRR